jgi:hypothetical protein
MCPDLIQTEAAKFGIRYGFTIPQNSSAGTRDRGSPRQPFAWRRTPPACGSQVDDQSLGLRSGKADHHALRFFSLAFGEDHSRWSGMPLTRFFGARTRDKVNIGERVIFEK